MTAEVIDRTVAPPPHVDASRIVDYDAYRIERHASSGDLHEALFNLTEEIGRGIFWTPHNGGHWFINDYKLLFEAARKPEWFSSTAMTIPPVPDEPKLIPLYLDPPEHGKFRQALAKEFSPSLMMKMKGSIREFAATLIDDFADKDRCEFVEALAEPLPVIIFMRLMGMPLDHLREFRKWIYDMLSPSDERRTAAYANIAELMDGLIRERQAQPRDDLISRLLDIKIDGRPVTYDEVQGYCLLLFAAGLDTVANSIAFGMNFLAGRPDLQQRLHANPTLIPDAVEELLRKFGVPTPARTAACDFEFGGVRIRKGERVMLMLPACNFDPAIHDDPYTFRLERENKTHLTFNAGPHRCVGSHLARIELRTFYEEWFKRMPTVRHDPDRKTVYRSGLTLAIQELPLVWDV